MRRSTPSVLLAVLVIAFAARAGETGSDSVTAANLFDQERDWPYRVSLTESWLPPGREVPLAAGTVGVLIRVERSGAARIDFSSDGKLEVPVAKTDLVANANRIRRGELEKSEPNFIHAIATRLVDSGSDQLTGFDPDRVLGHPGFLCVIADPGAPGFDDLARALKGLADRNRVMTLLFPQGAHSDAKVRDRLRKLEWTVPFVYDYLSEPYARTLLAEGTPIPTVLLQSDEGRVIYQGPFRPDAVSELRAVLDTAFAGDPSGPTAQRR